MRVRPPRSPAAVRARRGRMQRAGALAGFALALAAAIAGVTLLLREAPLASAPPTVVLATDLLAAPDPAAEPVARAPRGAALSLLGRSPDGAWLLVELNDAPGRPGWLPAATVRNAGPIDQLVRVPPPAASAPPGAAPAAGPSATPPPAGADLPDVVVQAAGSRQNRLVIVVANVGTGDLAAGLFARVNGGAARRIDIAGKPLRPGDALEAVLNTEFVQRRASVSIEIAVDSSARESRTDNNRLDVVVAPDLPNDLAIAGATLDPADGHLRVEVRNLSPIPIVGVLSIAVREAPPATRLLAIAAADVTLAPQTAEQVDVPEVRNVPVSRLAIVLSSDALTDANPANDSYPR